LTPAQAPHLEAHNRCEDIGTDTGGLLPSAKRAHDELRPKL